MIRSLVVLLLAGTFATQVPAAAELPSRAPGAVVGNVVVHTVARGETLGSIGARYGVEARTIADDNGFAPATPIRVGQPLRVDARHVVPVDLLGDITINVPQRLLFFHREGEPLRWSPVAVGKPGWETPIVPFVVRDRTRHPTWHVPISIQREMARQGKTPVAVVPPGPNNPLGEFMVALDLPGILIHSTNAPSSIYGFTTHGCIRLAPGNARALFDAAMPGTPGAFIYQRVLFGERDGVVFLEVHRDAYRRSADAAGATRQLAATLGVEDRIDWLLADDVVRAQAGVARVVTITPRTLLAGEQRSGRPAGLRSIVNALVDPK
jgi:L,D-transpeptidase ErfK/SrfK